VRQLVSLGRFPYQNWLRQWSIDDEQQVEEALRLTGTAALQHRPVDALSGGQRQRVWIAMTLAQATNTVLLDEPTTYLDLAHQIEILELLRGLNQQQGKTIVMVLHDLNLACRYADHLVAVHQGRIYAQGTPKQVMTETLVREVFNLRCRIIDDPFSIRHCAFLFREKRMLTSEEYAYLQNVFRLRTLAQADRRSVPGEAIGDVQTCRALLERVMPLIGAPDLAIAASLFAKRVAFLASGNVLYAMSVFDKGLPLSLNTCRLEYAHDGGLWTRHCRWMLLRRRTRRERVRRGVRPSSARYSEHSSRRCGKACRR
jgi:hypothetical protein